MVGLSLLGVMAPRWRDNDKSRRQAIHAYIRTRRDELIKELPAIVLSDKNTKRNELVRLGRARFAALPQEAQHRFFEIAEAGSPSASPVADAESRSFQDSRSAGPEVTSVAESRSTGETGIEKPAVEDAQRKTQAPGVGMTEGQAMRSCGVAECRSQVKNVIMAELPFLQKKFPGALVFDVLAASLRLHDDFSDELGTESHRVKAAIFVGVGAKLAGVSCSHTLDIWKHFTSPRMMPHMRSVEVRFVAAWAKKGL